MHPLNMPAFIVPYSRFLLFYSLHNILWMGIKVRSNAVVFPISILLILFSIKSIHNDSFMKLLAVCVSYFPFYCTKANI